jgi:hypothetical protein
MNDLGSQEFHFNEVLSFFPAWVHSLREWTSSSGPHWGTTSSLLATWVRGQSPRDQRSPAPANMSLTEGRDPGPDSMS